MNDKLNKVVIALSEERLKSAYNLTGQSEIITSLSYKAWNLTLCSSLYPLLQIIEICLRNSVHNAMQEHFKDGLWFKNKEILQSFDLSKVDQTIRNLVEMSRSTDLNHLVSELPFGFWTGLMAKSYERTIWHPLLKKIFPHIPKAYRTRACINERFKNVRKLRNRVFHHQRIWHYPDLLAQKQAIIDAIYWIEPAVIDYLKPIDQFDEVYCRGFEHYKIEIAKLLT